MKSHLSQVPFLFLLSTLRIGGPEKKAILIANTLRSKGYHVHLAYLNRPDTLVSLFIALIHDPQASQTMGDSARRIVEEKFTFTRMVRE